MARTVTLDGVNYSIPETGDEGWGTIVTDFLEAITLDTLQPSGGLFTLTAEVDFGATHGLKSAYFLSRTANAATAGAVRLASTDEINWRNPANSSNYALELNSSSERLSFRGIDLVDLSSSQTLRGKTLSSATLVDATISGLSLSSLGALEVAGNTVLGNDEANDTVIFNSRISSPLTPKSSSTDLGSNSNRWGDLYLENISASGTLTVGTLNAGSVDFSNATALSLSVSGPLTASSVSAASLSTSGALVAGVASLSNISGVSLSVSGAIQGASANLSSISATSLSASGAIEGASASFSNVSAVTLSASGALAAGSASLSNVSAVTLSASGALTAGAANLSSISAASLSTSGALAAGSASLSNVSAVTLSASGRIESASTVSALRVSASSSVSATKLSVNGSSSQLVTDGDFTYDAAQGSFLGRANGVVGPIGGGSGDDSWTMSDIGSNKIRFNEGDRVVNGIVYSTSGDVNTNSSVVAITNDTLTLLNSSNGMLYAVSGSVRVFTFYDIVDGTFHGIGNSAESSDYTWDYRNENPNFDINLSRYVPLGYVDVSATGSPGTITYTITNWPVGPWTTFNNVAAAEDWQDWVPTLTNTTNNAVTFARYRRVGNKVEARIYINFTGAGAGSNFGFSLPVAPNYIVATSGQNIVGSGQIRAAGTEQPAVFEYDSAFQRVNINAGTDGSVDGTAFTTANDFIQANLSYEIAAADGYNPISVGFPSVSDLTQTKFLSADTTSNASITDLATTVEVGKTYDVTLNVLGNVAATSSVTITFTDGSTTVGSWRQENGSAGTITLNTSKTIRYTATNTALTFVASGLAGASNIQGNGTAAETFVQVTEVPATGIGVLIDVDRSRITVNDGNGYGATNTKIRRFSSTVESRGSAITYADSATLGATFTINKAGVYQVRRRDTKASGSFRWGLSVNSTQLTTNIEAINEANILEIIDNTAGQTVPVTVVRRFEVGDVIRPHDASVLDSTTVNCSMTVEYVGV